MDRNRAIAVLFACALAAAPAKARAESFVRVLTQRAKVHTGPGAQFRTIYVAERGAVLPVVERGTRGYWFRVTLDDGTDGWVFGEQVTPFEVVEDAEAGVLSRAWRAIARATLGPSPIARSDVELSFSAGILGELGTGAEQMFLFRPAWIVDTHFALEGWAGLSPRLAESLYIAGLGWTLRLAPGGSLGPYLHAGVGLGHFRPKADAFALPTRTLMAVSAGGGIELTIKLRLTLRIDFRNWTFFDPDEAANAQEVSGGMAVFF